jgi:hypothetical protein
MYVGVADATGMHFDEDLVGAGLRLGNVFDLPRTAYSGNDCSFHNTSSLRQFDARGFALGA